MEAKRDSVFIGDFMIDLSLDLVRLHEPLELFLRARGIRFHSTHQLRDDFPPADFIINNAS
jgi:hypothetical protein